MAKKKRHSKLFAAFFTGIFVCGVAAAIWYAIPGYKIEPGYWVVEDAYKNYQSQVMAEVTGRVVRLLPDDPGSNRQQKFVITLKNQQNLMVIHSLRYSERVPVAVNDEVIVRGEYLRTEPGGVIHSTHWDSGIKKRHGWISHRGTVYQ